MRNQTSRTISDVNRCVADVSAIQTDSESLSFIESGRVKSDSMMIWDNMKHFTEKITLYVPGEI